MPAEPRCILFDLDNTLTDRSASIHQFAASLQHDFDRDLTTTGLDDLAAAIERCDAGGYRRASDFVECLSGRLPWRTPPGITNLTSYWYDVFPGCAQPMAGMNSVLDALSGIGMRMGVVTNGSVRSQSGKAERLGLQRWMRTLVISEEFGFGKPDGRLFQLALENVGATAAEAWFVGDHPVNDVRGARDAGLTPVWFRGFHPWPQDVAPPELRIDALSELFSMAVSSPTTD